VVTTVTFFMEIYLKLLEWVGVGEVVVVLVQYFIIEGGWEADSCAGAQPSCSQSLHWLLLSAVMQRLPQHVQVKCTALLVVPCIAVRGNCSCIINRSRTSYCVPVVLFCHAFSHET
jgi:hypothetical protein